MAKPKTPKSYKQMTQQLNQMVEWFESDEVDLDQAVGKYQEALRLLAEMEEYLKTTENKVKKIAAKFDE
ncbi:MAG TPA: exodeoxyribonuclease VII small subunit [Candidatus Saccharimonadales bacterium]|nr:exodeoxyribonuclease VII small subunit [Candidatus Saccharimonadales bacterium]